MLQGGAVNGKGYMFQKEVCVQAMDRGYIILLSIPKMSIYKGGKTGGKG
jgi:hypothetical protein